MNKQEKFIVLNEVTVHTLNLSEKLELLKDSIRFGLHNGKIGALNDIAHLCEQLVKSIDEYQDDSFTLDDLSDYKSGYEKNE